ncbi:DUF692 domain-containing protein [Chondromyces apiculatus]|uniref:Uncharacterized protein n=1 Tax=Chondromyces apiculatus DSM 436 TaxID=1192034 RepID=A0A017TEN7_9BACT|nr:DUF692 domain-containing protein [Chondromyces apiculatus]EYF07382.1 Hypothetical protein CAP_0135 [Chondromyces apiculatus DSM 436]
MTSLPFLGVGLSYRWELHASLLQAAGHVDWIEITPEHFMPLGPDGLRRLEGLARRFPVAGHSLELSLGSGGTTSARYREQLGAILGGASALWHGDHVCFTEAGERAIHALTPLPFCEAAVEATVRGIREVRGALGVPLVVENIVYYLDNPLSEMDEASFLRRVVLEADCGLLLDLHNVFTNAVNQRFDPYRFLDRLPLERVLQIHLAGGETFEGVRLDTHAAGSPEEVWSLLDHVAPRCPVRGVNLEMDAHFLPAPRLIEELGRARAALERCGARGVRCA